MTGSRGPRPAGISRLRSLKHRLFLVWKRVRWPIYRLTEPAVLSWRTRRPYRYDAADFAGCFVSGSRVAEAEMTAAVPRRIFVCWAGVNPMSPVREAALSEIRDANHDLEVVLVDPRSLPDWIVADQPLHPAYEHLHLVHRSDYLRCYLLHFHGGGYADIKPGHGSWRPALDRFDASAAWLMGARNPSRLMTPNFADRDLDRLMRRTSHQRLSQSALVARPGSPLTLEWWTELNRVLDLRAPELARHPGGVRDEVEGYPIAWNGLLAQLLDPLTVKYAPRVLVEDSLMYHEGAPYL